MRLARILLLALCGALALARPVSAALADVRTGGSEADAVFLGAKSALLQLRILIGTGGPQSAIGSGFVVSADGLVVTNYHVVSQYALEPGQFTIEYVRTDGSRGPLTLLAIDVVHDLAVLRMAGEGLPHFELRGTSLAKGERGYSLGNPHDLGPTIVEGTYNGLTEGSYYDQIHFTGAINAGMSGGPAVDRNGRVFGVNVAHHVSGELIGFLVPVKYVQRLLERTGTLPAPEAAEFRNEIRAQLMAHQAELASKLLGARLPVKPFGHYALPDSPGPYLRCWGRSLDEPDRLYDSNVQYCNGNMELFVSGSMRTGGISFWHMALSSEKLSSLQFRQLYEERFAATYGGHDATRKDYTRFRCRDDFVRAGRGVMRAVICARAYKRFAGLYDFRVRIASLEPGDQGLQSALMLDGFSFENGMALSRRYLESISWKN